MTPDRELMHPGFLADADEYLASERFWADLFDRIPHADEWRTPWLDDAGFRDGSPIFTAVSPALRRGIYVLQCAPEEVRPAESGDPNGGWDDPPIASSAIATRSPRATRGRSTSWSSHAS